MLSSKRKQSFISDRFVKMQIPSVMQNSLIKIKLIFKIIRNNFDSIPEMG